MLNIGYLKQRQAVTDRQVRNLDDFERKGRLCKKSLNSDQFKERVFVLDVSNLFYYKSESSNMVNNYNLVVLLDATIKMFDFDTLKQR